jgi:hypothetical protein
VPVPPPAEALGLGLAAADGLGLAAADGLAAAEVLGAAADEVAGGGTATVLVEVSGVGVVPSSPLLKR